MVSVVTPGQGAAKAGLEPRDVIVSIDGREIKDGDDLVADISSRRVGSTAQIGFLRDGQKKSAAVTIGDRSKISTDLAANDSDDSSAGPQESDAGQNKLGIKVAPIPANLATKAGIKGGVIITDVRPGSFADEIGLGKRGHHYGDQPQAGDR